MFYKIIAVVSLMVLTGCATPLHKQVFNGIHAEDSQDKLLELLGQPDQFRPSERMAGAQAWYYTRGGETCGFTVYENVVKYIACSGKRQSDRSVAQSVGSAFSAFGQSIQGGSSAGTSINCTGTTLSGTTYTNCH